MSICLNMIVKNESAIIERCLASLAPFIDCYVICDTGSTDDTAAVIGEFFSQAGIAGEIHATEFQDFGSARNEALAICRRSLQSFDYILFCDADMELRVDDPEFRHRLAEPAYSVRQFNQLSYYNVRLIRRDLEAIYIGLTHEYLSVGMTVSRLDGIYFLDHACGASRSEKLERDARLLLRQIELPNVSIARTSFYLAQTYREAGALESAVEWYGKRIEAGGWQEESWYARYMLALTHLQAGNEADFIRGCLEAYNAHPTRSEPLHALARHYRIAAKSEAAMLICEMAEQIPYPADDVLFVDDAVYSSGIAEEMSISGYYCASPARREKGRAACLRLMTDRNAALQTRASARANWLFYSRSAEEIFGGITMQRLDVEVAEPYTAMNPSIAIDNGMIECVVRTVNYRIVDGRYQIADSNQVLRTRNLLCNLDSDLHTLAQKEMIERDTRSVVPSSEIAGFEDCRLFRWLGRWWCTATVRDRDPNWRCEIALLELSEHAQVERVHMLRTYHPELMQKNWLPFVRHDQLCFVYTSDPLIILSYDPVTGVLREEIAQTPPIALDHLRGGSQVIPISGGWLYLAHEVIPAGPSRVYLHRFVRLDEDFNLAAISEPFYFIKRGIEFAAGLAIDETRGRLLVSFGAGDCEAWVMSVDRDRVLHALQ